MKLTLRKFIVFIFCLCISCIHKEEKVWNNNYFQIEIDSRMSLFHQNIFISAIHDWKQIIGTDIILEVIITSTNDTLEFNKIKIIDSPPKTGSVGNCEFIEVFGRPLGAVITIRESDNPSREYVDREYSLTARHELGHALGLKHYSGTYPSVMKEVGPSDNIECIDQINVCQKWNCMPKCELN